MAKGEISVIVSGTVGWDVEIDIDVSHLADENGEVNLDDPSVIQQVEEKAFDEAFHLLGRGDVEYYVSGICDMDAVEIRE